MPLSYCFIALNKQFSPNRHMRRILTSIIVALFFGSMAKAQEGIPVYFDYLADNYYLVYRQWPGSPREPKSV